MVASQLLIKRDPTSSRFDEEEFFPDCNDYTGISAADSDWEEEGAEESELTAEQQESFDQDLQSGRELIENVEVTEKFQRLKTDWRKASEHMSSPTDFAMLPLYQGIIGMGEAAVPLILSELESEPELWFWALRAITGEDPVPPQSRGRIREMAQAWIKWGHQNGYEW